MLEVNLLKVEQPLFGFDTTVTTHVLYILTNSKDNTNVFVKTVTAEYTATIGDDFFGIARLRIANEGSAKKNIESLLRELSKLKISPQQVSLHNPHSSHLKPVKIKAVNFDDID